MRSCPRNAVPSKRLESGRTDRTPKGGAGSLPATIRRGKPGNGIPSARVEHLSRVARGVLDAGDPTTRMEARVRHGESAGNVNPASRRSDDPPLTERGRAQAARAAAALSRIGIDAVCSSPLRRARETAEAIAAAACAGAARTVQGFAEVDMGALSDAETPDGRAERESIFEAWLAGDRRRAFPGGEDFEAVVRRVREGLRALAAASPGARIVLVTHRMPIAAAAAMCEAGGATASAGGCANGSITAIESEDGERWRLVAWGDARHLT